MPVTRPAYYTLRIFYFQVEVNAVILMWNTFSENQQVTSQDFNTNWSALIYLPINPFVAGLSVLGWSMHEKKHKLQYTWSCDATTSNHQPAFCVSVCINQQSALRVVDDDLWSVAFFTCCLLVITWSYRQNFILTSEDTQKARCWLKDRIIFRWFNKHLSIYWGENELLFMRFESGQFDGKQSKYSLD